MGHIFGASRLGKAFAVGDCPRGYARPSTSPERLGTQLAGDSHDARARCACNITSSSKDINQATMSPMCCVLGLLQAAVSPKSGIGSERSSSAVLPALCVRLASSACAQRPLVDNALRNSFSSFHQSLATCMAVRGHRFSGMGWMNPNKSQTDLVHTEGENRKTHSARKTFNRMPQPTKCLLRSKACT